VKPRYVALGILFGFGLVVFVYYLVRYFNKQMVQIQPTPQQNVGVDVSPFLLTVSPIGIQDLPTALSSETPLLPDPVLTTIPVEPIEEDIPSKDRPSFFAQFVSFIFWVIGVLVTTFIFTLGTAAFITMTYQGTLPTWIGIPLAAFSAIIGLAGLVKLLRSHKEFSG
jgi:hypothetical protein